MGKAIRFSGYVLKIAVPTGCEIIELRVENHAHYFTGMAGPLLGANFLCPKQQKSFGGRSDTKFSL